MAAIPTVPGSIQVQTPNAGVPKDFSALNAPNEARFQMAGAIGEAGQALNEFSQKLQAAKNFGIAADADRMMRQATADFHTSLAGRTDEENWANDWKDRAEQVRGQIYDTHAVGPALRRQLDSNIKDWSQANGIEVNTLARKQMINRTVERADLAADEAAKSGDEKGIYNALTPLAKIGAAYPEQVQAMIKKNLDKVDQYKADTIIENNPPIASDWLREKDDAGNYVNATRLDPDQRRIKIREADVARSHFQAQNFDGMKADIDNGNVPAEEQLVAMENKKLISAQGAQGIRYYIKQKGSLGRVEDQPQLASVVAARINAIPAGLDADHRRPYISDIVTSREYLTLMEPARKIFDNQLKVDPIPDRPAVAERKKLDDEDRTRNGTFLPMAFKAPETHLFKPDEPGKLISSNKTLKDIEAMDDDEVAAKFGSGMTKRQLLDTEEKNWGSYLTAMRGYEKEHPEATDEQLTVESQRLKKPYVMGAVAQALAAPASPGATQSNVTKEQYDALKSGDAYWWNGKRLTKK